PVGRTYEVFPFAPPTGEAVALMGAPIQEGVYMALPPHQADRLAGHVHPYRHTFLQVAGMCDPGTVPTDPLPAHHGRTYAPASLTSCTGMPAFNPWRLTHARLPRSMSGASTSCSKP